MRGRSPRSRNGDKRLSLSLTSQPAIRHRRPGDPKRPRHNHFPRRLSTQSRDGKKRVASKEHEHLQRTRHSPQRGRQADHPMLSGRQPRQHKRLRLGPPRSQHSQEKLLSYDETRPQPRDAPNCPQGGSCKQGRQERRHLGEPLIHSVP